jgi:hypothetical protein
MGRLMTQQWLAIAGIGLFGLCTVQTASAAPPAGRQNVAAAQSSAAHLDLRPPSHVFEASEKASTSFPSMAHRQSFGGQDQQQLPVLGSEGVRPRNSMADIAQRVRREGLPVARLFETKSALVHLGLNQRGKPGLWLVQKTR